MTKCLSWKINDDNYAYLYIPNKKTHISTRITDSIIINKIIDKVNSWTEDKYKQAFNEMNEEVFSVFNVKIPYSEKYFGNIQNTNVLVLGTSKEEKDKFEEIKNELLDVIDKKVSFILNEIKESNKTTVELLNKRTIDSAKASKESLNEAMTKLEIVKKDVEKKFTSATKLFNKAAKVLELDNLEINSDSLKNLFLVTDNNDKWISSYSGDIQTIRSDYNEYKSKLPLAESSKNVFKDVRERIERINDDIKIVSKTNEIVKENVRKIQKEQEDFKERQHIINGNDMVMSSSVPNEIKEMVVGNSKIIIDRTKIVIENLKTNTSIVVDEDNIMLNGNVFINGKKI